MARYKPTIREDHKYYVLKSRILATRRISPRPSRTEPYKRLPVKQPEGPLFHPDYIKNIVPFLTPQERTAMALTNGATYDHMKIEGHYELALPTMSKRLVVTSTIYDRLLTLNNEGKYSRVFNLDNFELGQHVTTKMYDEVTMPFGYTGRMITVKKRVMKTGFVVGTTREMVYIAFGNLFGKEPPKVVRRGNKNVDKI